MANDPNFSKVVSLLPGEDVGETDPSYAYTVFGMRLFGIPLLDATDVKGAVVTATGSLAYSANGCTFNGSSKLSATCAVPDGFNFGTGDFTIEFFMSSSVPWSSQTGSAGIVGTSQGGWCLYRNTSVNTDKISLRINGTDYPTASVPEPFVVTHWAFCRQNGTLRIFRDGVLDVSYSSTVAPSAETLLTIGYATSWGGYFRGTLRELRITKGLARYVTNFTPSDKFLTAAPGVAIDKTGKTWAEYGSPQRGTTQYKWGSGSIYLDGSSFLVTRGFSFGNQDFTIEGWFKAASIPTTFPRLFGQYSNTYGGVLVDIGAVAGSCQLWGFGKNNTVACRAIGKTVVSSGWHHIAVCRKGNILALLIDGNVEGAMPFYGDCYEGVFVLGTASESLGAMNLTGSIDDFRVTSGLCRYDFTAEPYYSSTVAYLPFKDQELICYDVSRNKAVTSAAITAVQTTDPFGATGYVASFDGTNSYANFASSADLALGTADFTIEVWVKPTASKGMQVLDARPASTAGAYINIWINTTHTVQLFVNDAVQILSTATIALNTWWHIAVVRAAGTTKLYINGVSQGSWVDATNYRAAIWRIGDSAYNASERFIGQMRDFRVTKGAARYTANFTPAQITEVTGTYTVPPEAFSAASTKISGIVKDSTGAFAARTVNAHSHATGAFLGSTTSSAVDGTFSIAVPERCYVVALDTDASGQNALVLDRLDPV